MNLTARQKTAILISVLPPQLSMQIMQELGPEASSILLETSKLQLTDEMKSQVLEEFMKGVDGPHPVVAAPTFSTSRVLPMRNRPFAFLAGVDAKTVVRLVRREHPQAITVILSYLPREQASSVLQELLPEVQSEVARRLTEMSQVNRDVLEEMQKILDSRLHAVLEGEYRDEGDGQEHLLEILNHADRSTEEKVMSGISVKNPRLAGDLKNRLCDFEDLINLEDGSLQQVLRVADMRDLCVALKGSAKALAERVYRVMAPEAARALRNDVERIETPSWDEVRSAQKNIRNILRGLMALGKVRFIQQKAS
ncbi:MAG: FliG C-terminal domain-containing protein [Candidatus Xenobia bacterium]